MIPQVQPDAALIPRPLPPVADFVDERLANIDRRIDWLVHLSPCENDRMWERFVASEYSQEPELRYPPLTVDPRAIQHELSQLPLADVEHPLLHALLSEKQKECELFALLLETRDTKGALAISLELFGGTEAHLVRLAKRVLQEVPRLDRHEELGGFGDVAEAARTMFENLSNDYPDFSSRLIPRDDLNSHIMVHEGQLHVDRGIAVPKSRILPLLSHEIGTHVLTHQNGTRQGLRLLEIGLSGYDELQEGLGVLAEYLAGYLPPERLRVLAARVLASQMVAEGDSFVSMFSFLTEEHGIDPKDAFDVVVRARRGGGLTKDAIYLRGLYELVEHIKEGGQLAPLYAGKFALAHLPILAELRELGWVVPARILPDFLVGSGAAQRLSRARELNVEQLFHMEPEPS